MLFFKKQITISVTDIKYQSESHVFVDYAGMGIWLRKSRLRIKKQEDGQIFITLSQRYLRGKLRKQTALIT